MLRAKCVRLNLKSALVIVFLSVIIGVKQSQTAINNMEESTKREVQKNNTANNDFVTIVKNQTELSSCPTDVECNTLQFPCIKCNYNYSCLYGKDLNVTCDVYPGILCAGNKSFTREMKCRYCYQTERWEHDCVQKGNCNSIYQYYKTNCTTQPHVLCLGNRVFLRNIKCNWTQGYKWSTALIISLTLGGFGADRFYLGHWQEGIGKLFSFGGLGVWTIIDVLLISLHYLGPADGSLYI